MSDISPVHDDWCNFGDGSRCNCGAFLPDDPMPEGLERDGNKTPQPGHANVPARPAPLKGENKR